jgi:hypothetical protein
MIVEVFRGSLPTIERTVMIVIAPTTTIPPSPLAIAFGKFGKFLVWLKVAYELKVSPHMLFGINLSHMFLLWVLMHLFLLWVFGAYDSLYENFPRMLCSLQCFL